MCEISSFGESPICKNCEHTELSNLVPQNYKNYRLYPHLINILLYLNTKETQEQNRTIISIFNRISMYSIPNILSILNSKVIYLKLQIDL